MPFRIGIDLGTTYCALTMIDPKDGNPVIIQNSEGEQLIIPSAIYFKNGLYNAGLDAKEMFESGDKDCAVFFKRSMGEKENGADSVCFVAEKGTPHERGYTAVELSSMLLLYLKEEAETAVGDSISEAVITCPAYFYDNERDCILRAAASIGLQVQELLEEPAAAALAYGRRHWHVGARVLVYDLGGGTFDVTVVEMGNDRSMPVIGTMGRKFLGGKDFDEALLQLVLRELASSADVDVNFVSPKERAILYGEIENVKIKFSSLQTVRVSGIVGGQKATAEISRNKFEKECTDILHNTGTLIDQLLKKINISQDEISDVLLVGGSTLMPCVKEYLTQKFGKQPLTQVNPVTAVAIGAAIRTLETNSNSNSIGLIKLSKTATHTMGVIAISADGTEYLNEHIIPAGTSIPCKLARRFKYYTTKKSLNTIELFVLQGDSLKPSECYPQNKYVVSGIRHIKNNRDEGTLVRIQYSYDKNGIIRVQARQEDDIVDLPISKDEVPQDMTMYYKPVVKKQNNSDSTFMGIQFGGGLNQGVLHKYKEVTFSNVEWKKWGNVTSTPPSSFPNEPTKHVIDKEKTIEFHGYNERAMNAGVEYFVNPDDYFEIECNIDVSNINGHPGGNVNITLGIITADIYGIDDNGTVLGGNMLLDGEIVKRVGLSFKLKMSVDKGNYDLFIDDELVGSKHKQSPDDIRVSFGLKHDAHCCSKLSRASISNIEMKQGKAGSGTGDGAAETWDD